MTNPLQAGLDHAELRRLAEAATPGPWWETVGMSGMSAVEADDDEVLASYLKGSNAAYIAAANPAVVVALLNEIEGLKDERDRLKMAICGGEDVPGAINAVSVDDCERFIATERLCSQWSAEQQAELDALRAAPVLPDRGWRPIACSDPAGGERVLIFRPSDFLEDRIFTVFLDEDDWWSVHDGKHDHHLRGNQPTHWMPLPDAPAEGAE